MITTSKRCVYLLMAALGGALLAGNVTVAAAAPKAGAPTMDTRSERRPRAAAPVRPSRAKIAAAPAWELKGSRIIACCCTAPCPCRINKPPTFCHGCDATTAVRIDRGHLGRVRMDGVAYAVVQRSFAADVAGNWLTVYISDTASPAQVQALRAMFDESLKPLGKKLPYLVGKVLAIQSVPMTYHVSADRREHHATIPGILEVKTRAIILPGHRKPVVSTGIFDEFGDQFIHAEPLVHTYRDPTVGREWDLAGRQANQADFALNPKRVARGGIGWGCWSAHADFGSREKYPEQIIGGEHHGSCCEKKKDAGASQPAAAPRR